MQIFETQQIVNIPVFMLDQASSPDILREINDFMSEGLITEDDYNEKKKELLDQF